MIEQYDRQGQPISIERWCQLHGDLDYKRVARDELADGTVVSTVWLGLDHGTPWIADSTPLIFETMVFPAPDVWEDQECWHWPTEETALAGHDQIVAKITEAVARLRAACDEIAAGDGSPP